MPDDTPKGRRYRTREVLEANRTVWRDPEVAKMARAYAKYHKEVLATYDRLQSAIFGRRIKFKW